jgi:hypothetical protein
MTRENVRSRLDRLEEELGSARRTGTLRFPDDLDLESTKGKAWLNAYLPEWPVALVPEPAEDTEEWQRRFAPRDDAQK